MAPDPIGRHFQFQCSAPSERAALGQHLLHKTYIRMSQGGKQRSQLLWLSGGRLVLSLRESVSAHGSNHCG